MIRFQRYLYHCFLNVVPVSVMKICVSNPACCGKVSSIDGPRIAWHTWQVFVWRPWIPGPGFSLLLRVSSDFAQPITDQATEVTCPVIARPQPSKRQKTGPDSVWCFSKIFISWFNAVYGHSVNMYGCTMCCMECIIKGQGYEKHITIIINCIGLLQACHITVLANAQLTKMLGIQITIGAHNCGLAMLMVWSICFRYLGDDLHSDIRLSFSGVLGPSNNMWNDAAFVTTTR